METGARLLIAEAHPLMREGLEQAAQEALQPISIDCAGSVAEALGMTRMHSGYRLAVVATDLPDSLGLSAFVQVQSALAGVPVALLCDQTASNIAETARMLGAAGYLAKTWRRVEMVAALRAVFEGGPVFPAPKGAVASQAQAIALQSLSGAQLRVVLALADGRSNKQIAGDLGVTEATVKAHLSATFRKLGVQNRAQVLLAMRPLLAE